MATTKSGGTSRSSSTPAKTRSTPSRSTTSRGASSSRGNSGSFLSVVRDRPFTAAAIAAGAAGASAFLWAKRAQLTEQVNNLSEAIGEKFSSTATATELPVGETRKASATDPMMEEQSAVGAISY